MSTTHEHGQFAFDGKGRRRCTECGAEVSSSVHPRDLVPMWKFWAVTGPVLVVVTVLLAAFIRAQS